MDRSEFERLYYKQFDRVYRYALALTARPAHAEEIAQEAFARLLRDGNGHIREPEAWLMRVARNLAVELIREQARSRSGFEVANSRDPEQLLLLDEIQRRLLTALAKLAESQRDCLALREYGGLSYEEIAGVMEISVDQVKVHLFRARQHLKKDLEDLA
jgi:RNA polymerase sigma factor (sigma-70 family)